MEGQSHSRIRISPECNQLFFTGGQTSRSEDIAFFVKVFTINTLMRC